MAVHAAKVAVKAQSAIILNMVKPARPVKNFKLTHYRLGRLLDARKRVSVKATVVTFGS